MSTDPLGEPELEVLDEKASQFHLIHLMGIITVAGIACALLAPVLRALSSEQVLSAITVATIQLAVVGGGCFGVNYRRHFALRESGKRIGQSFTGSPGRQTLISVIVLSTLLFGCLCFVVISLGEYSPEIKNFPHKLVIESLFVAFISVPFLLHIYWRRHLGVVEFFEHGVALTLTKFTPWESVEVQSDQSKANAIQLIVTTSPKKCSRITVPALVSPELHSYLLKHHSNPDPPREKEPLKKQTLF